MKTYTKTIEVPMYEVQIHHAEDFFFESHKDWIFEDCAMHAFHRDYDLSVNSDIKYIDDMEAYLKTRGLTYLPVYIFEHSSITISTKPYNCRFDSGLLGYVTSLKLSESELEKRINRYDAILHYGMVEYCIYIKGEYETAYVRINNGEDNAGVLEDIADDYDIKVEDIVVKDKR